MAHFSFVHEWRNTAKSIEWVLVVRIVVVKNVTHSSNRLNILVVATSVMQWSRIGRHSIGVCEVYSSNKTNLPAGFDVISERWNVLTITFVHCQFCDVFAFIVDELELLILLCFDFELIQSCNTVANFLIDHLVLVAIDELDLYWCLIVTLAQLLIIKLYSWEFIIHFIYEVVTFMDLSVVATWASINLHEISGWEVALGDFGTFWEALHFKV